MKKTVQLLIIVIAAGVLFVSCEKKKSANIVPDKFSVGISNAISSPDLAKKALFLEPEQDLLTGETLYRQLRNLVYIGEMSAEMIDATIRTIRRFNIDKPMSLFFESELDNRVKDVEVKENVQLKDATWDYAMYVKDDENMALQVFWNIEPVKGLAIMNIGVLNQTAVINRNAYVMIEYSEDDAFYDRYMMVHITNMDSLTINFMNKMKLFAGQKGDVVYIRGNSNHPSAVIIDAANTEGKSWAFVAKNNVIRDVATAKVALPPPMEEVSTNLWENYSMEKVLEEEVRVVFGQLQPTELEALVTLVTRNAKTPAFFNSNGFVAAGADKRPADIGFSDELVNLDDLMPFPPIEVKNLQIVFFQEN